MKKKEKPSKETLDSWHSDPSNWIFGIFYFNKEESRIFPPKRIAHFGWTVNFANPISILAIAAIIALVSIIQRSL